MSLYIGNLSSRTRRDELERVFRRFGRCNVRIKDRYGFVVYEYPPNAEKALKVLHNRRICGEFLTLSWSNKQPTKVRRFGRTSNRNSEQREEYFERELDMDYRHPNNGRGLPDYADLEAAYHRKDIRDYFGEEQPGYRGDLWDLDGRFQQDLVGNDRWDDQFREPSTEVMVRNEVGFERYEPYQGDDKRDFVNEATLDYPKQGRSQKACYNCGGSGHKMQTCPQKAPSGKQGHHDNNIQGRNKRQVDEFQPSSWDEKQASRDPTLIRRRGKEKTLSSMEKEREPILMSQSKEIDSFRENNLERKGRKEVEYLEGQTSRPFSKSKSVSSRAHSPSPDSRSASTSHNSKSKRARARSSSPTSLLLSLSLGQDLPSSSNKGSLKGSLDTPKTPESKEILDEHGESAAGDTGFDSEKIENEVMALNKENLMSPSQMGNELEELQPLPKENDEYQIAALTEYEAINSSTPSTDKGEAARSPIPENLRVPKEREIAEALQIDTMLVLNENLDLQAPTSSLPVRRTDISLEELQTVLKHSSLDLPDDNERKLTTEAFFGSARFWPWEIIYYRRLKKGLISMENYARRINQNEEFGIVDKYIRSSSGWEELTH